ncbi:hypothetical protein AADR41_31155, partial [Streptomyces sp. CLV115]
MCQQDGVRVANKDRAGNLSQNGDTLTVKWNKGATGYRITRAGSPARRAVQSRHPNATGPTTAPHH